VKGSTGNLRRKGFTSQSSTTTNWNGWQSTNQHFQQWARLLHGSRGAFGWVSYLLVASGNSQWQNLPVAPQSPSACGSESEFFQAQKKPVL
jgi:hypothetical protein